MTARHPKLIGCDSVGDTRKAGSGNCEKAREIFLNISLAGDPNSPCIPAQSKLV